MVSTKIVATIGPASDSIEGITSLIRAGVNVFRFNLKHNNQEWHSTRIGRVRQASREAGIPVAVLLDLQGPEIRIGTFKEGKIALAKGDEVYFVTARTGQKRKEIILNNLALLEKLEKGHTITIDDGHFRFTVLGKSEKEVIVTVEEGGVLKNKKGVNVPDLELDLPTLVTKDIEDISMAAREDVDYVALSFVRTAEDIRVLRTELARQKVNVQIVAKIETAKALHHFDEILLETDAVMVARGDLGVELPLEQVPYHQKHIIKRCQEVGKPVITATQMLESMIDNPLPTRAEVSDVANSIYDFTDAVMLSAESAVGLYPVEAVKMMVKISEFIEKKRPHPEGLQFEIAHQTGAVTKAAYDLISSEFCQREKIKGFVVLSETGMTARMLARLRPSIPIFALTRREKVRDQLLLSYAVFPLLFSFTKGAYEKKSIDQIHAMVQVVKDKGFITTGDKVVMVYGEDWGTPGKTSVIRIQEVS